jgi:SAM-dependent methyltransferase
VHLDPLPDQSTATSNFSAGYFAGDDTAGYADYVADEAIHRRNARRHLRRAARAGARPPGTLLEVGCAAGFLLDEARCAGWDVHGVDVAAEMRTAATGLGVPVADTVGATGLGPASVDLAVLNQVLEHVADPGALLDELAGLVRPGGLLTIETWDRSSALARALGPRWQQVSPPSVLWLFGRSDLAGLLAQHGFRPVRIRPAVKLVSVDTVGGQARWLRGVATGRVRRLAIPYAFGDLVVALAVREHPAW